MADLGGETGEGYFVDFPAIWNVVLLYLFAFMPPPVVSLLIVGFFVLLTLVPILAVHPFRVAELRPVTGDSTVGGGGNRRHRQSVSLAAVGQDTARVDSSHADGNWLHQSLARSPPGIDLRLALGY
jgi:hypothetical protein